MVFCLGGAIEPEEVLVHAVVVVGHVVEAVLGVKSVVVELFVSGCDKTEGHHVDIADGSQEVVGGTVDDGGEDG